jgi:hypothetical protein
MELFESPVSDVLQFFEDKNMKLMSKSYLCYGDKPLHVIAIDYFKRSLPKTWWHHLMTIHCAIRMDGYQTVYGLQPGTLLKMHNFLLKTEPYLVTYYLQVLYNLLKYMRLDFVLGMSWSSEVLVSSSGGATMFLEDWPRISTFNLGTSGGSGFNKQPTNHYMRPFYLAINQMELFESPVSDVLQFFEDKNMKLMSTYYLQVLYNLLKYMRLDFVLGMSWSSEVLVLLRV